MLPKASLARRFPGRLNDFTGEEKTITAQVKFIKPLTFHYAQFRLRHSWKIDFLTCTFSIGCQLKIKFFTIDIINLVAVVVSYYAHILTYMSIQRDNGHIPRNISSIKQ